MKTIIFPTIFLSLFVLMATSCRDNTVDNPNNKPLSLDSLIILSPDSVPLLVERGEANFIDYKLDLAMIDAAKAFRLDSNNSLKY